MTIWEQQSGIDNTVEAHELKLFIARAAFMADKEPWRMEQIAAVREGLVANMEDLRFVQLCRFVLVDPEEMAQLIYKAIAKGDPNARRQIELLIKKGEGEKMRRLQDASKGVKFDE